MLPFGVVGRTKRPLLMALFIPSLSLSGRGTIFTNNRATGKVKVKPFCVSVLVLILCLFGGGCIQGCCIRMSFSCLGVQEGFSKHTFQF